MQDDELMKCCKDLNLVLSDECFKDIDGYRIWIDIEDIGWKSYFFKLKLTNKLHTYTRL